MTKNKWNFLDELTLETILSQLGWDYANRLSDYVDEHDLYNGNIPFRADFYPEGVRLASSEKAKIVSDGKTIIKYKDATWFSPWMIFECHGEQGLKDINQWVFVEERQWLIKKLNGDWVRPFTLLTECPFRTSIRC